MVSKITENIYIGTTEEAKHWVGRILCVLEQRPQDEPAKAISIPILRTAQDGQIWTMNGGIPEVDLDNLYMIADIISRSVRQNEKILVHCARGVERSPLAVVWYLHTLGDSINLAYDRVRDARPETADRRVWLPQEMFKATVGIARAVEK